MNHILQQQLRLCANLPTPPSIAAKLIELANDPHSDLTQIANCVALDPALAAKMLRAAHSPLYNARRTATNVRQAVNLMGLHAAVTIALSFSLVQHLYGRSDDQGHLLFWKRSVLSALSCRILAERFGFNPDDLHVAGLLQDIGILALRAARPDAYPDMALTLDDEALLEMEKKTFGASHDEVGYWLLSNWRLPEHLASACLVSRAAPPAKNTLPSQVGCVAVSGYFADVFLKPEEAALTRTLADAARRWLGMDANSTAEVLESMSRHVNEYEEIFDLPLIEATQIQAILEQAKELTMFASLGKMRELEEKTQRDGLTGIHNRLYFDEVLRNEFAISTNHGWPLSIAFIDIDHFKRVNDTYGHAVGDHALVTLSRLIASQIRSGDVFARYGGEEFVLLFPGTSTDESALILSRIRNAIEGVVHTVGTQTFSMTISAGLACHNAGEVAYRSAEELLHTADSALYAAKRMGRNQVICTTE